MKTFLALLQNDLKLVKHRVHRMDRYDWILWGMIGLFICYFTLASFLRYDNFYTGRYDLGNMVQTVWNTAHGRFLQASDGMGVTSRLSYHADFFLAFLAPFYLIWPNPKLLLLVQAIVVALGAWFVYKLSRDVLHQKAISLFFAFSYLLSPSLERSTLYDFHAVVLATTFLLGAFYFMRTRRYLLFLLLSFLAGSTKEEVWAIVGFFGVFIMTRALYARRAAPSRMTSYLKREFMFGFVVSCLSFLTFYLFFSVIIPSYHGSAHFASAYFQDFGDKPVHIASGIIKSPGKVIAMIFQPDQKAYLRQLFLPLGYLSILSPLYLLFALPDLLINLLSSNNNFHQIYYQYTATITPFLFIAAIFGVRLLRYFLPRISTTIILIYLFVMSVYGAYLYGPLPFAKDPNDAMFLSPRRNSQAIEMFLRQLPSDAIVAANNQVGSHLSNRQIIYTIPESLDKAEYILYLLSDSTASPSPQENRYQAERMLNNPNYILLYRDGDFLALKKNSMHLPSVSL
jgi:uncharacterized membrane protein